MATAKEIIEHPRRYPGAHIGAFGPNAVEAYKQARLKQLKTHSGSEAEFWISSRLGYRDREAALDLALAGDGGAGTAVTRNVTLEAMYAKDRDERMAQAVDTYMRFPATRAGIKAGIVLVNNPTCGLEAMLFQESMPQDPGHDPEVFGILDAANLCGGAALYGWGWRRRSSLLMGHPDQDEPLQTI